MLRASLRLLLFFASAPIAALAIACAGDDGGASPGSTPVTPPAAASASAVPPTPDALGDPEADGERVREHVRMLAEEIGPRVAGTDGETAGRTYVRDVLASYGYDTTFQPFDFELTNYLPSRVDAGELALPAIGLKGTAGGSVEAALVDAGLGAPGDYPAGGINGAIALVERGDITFREKALNAAAAGAGAVIIYNNEDERLIANLNETVALPVVGISKDDGERIVALLAAGQVNAKVVVPPLSATGYNVVAKPAAGATCETVTGGHYDSVPVTGGASDNASGTAAVLEVARLAAANDLPGANCFVFFGAEEFGLFGSAAYVEMLSDAEVNAMRAMLNLDVVGNTTPLRLIGTADTVEIARAAGAAAGIEGQPSAELANATSDHASFIRGGIPAVFFNRDDPLIHTTQDAVARMDPSKLEEAVRIAYATLEALNGR